MESEIILFSIKRLFRFGPLFFLLCLLPVRSVAHASPKTVIRSGFFSRDSELMRIAAQYGNDRELLVEKANRYLRRSGYSLSRVLSTRSSNGTLILEMEEGRLRAFPVFGATKISRGILDSYLSFRPGDIFNRNRLRLQLKKLAGTGLFDSITYRIIPSRNTVWVRVTMKKRSYFQIDGNYTTQYGLMPYLGFVHRNLFSSRILMDLNAECGFRERLNYYQFRPRLLAGDYFFHFSYRKGRRFINRDDYSSEEAGISAGRDFSLSPDSRISVAVPVESRFFYDTSGLPDLLFPDGLRTGLILCFTRSDRRNVLEDREETVLRLEASLMLIRDQGGFCRFTSYYRTYRKFTQDTGLLFRNSAGYLIGRKAADQLFLMGGDYQRGYSEGTHTADLKFENTLELDQEIFFGFLKAALFLDVSFFRFAQDQRKALLSYGPGLLMNIGIFRAELYYGAPFTASFLSGNFYFSLSRIIY